MKSEFRFVQEFSVDNKPFRLVVTWDNQIILENREYITDCWGDTMAFDAYRVVGARTGAKVYKKAFSIALNVIFGQKLKTFWFSTGFEPKREKLYDRIAKRLQTKYGFYCYQSNGVYRFYQKI